MWTWHKQHVVFDVYIFFNIIFFLCVVLRANCDFLIATFFFLCWCFGFGSCCVMVAFSMYWYYHNILIDIECYAVILLQFVKFALWLSLFSRIIRIISLFIPYNFDRQHTTIVTATTEQQANFLISCIDFVRDLCTKLQSTRFSFTYGVCVSELRQTVSWLSWYFMEIWLVCLCLAGGFVGSFDVKLMLYRLCFIGHRCQPNEGN